MTRIADIPQGKNRERLRQEILDNVEARRGEARDAFDALTKYVGVVYSGGAIAILSFIAARKDSHIPDAAIWSFLCFAGSILSFAVFLYRHYQLHTARWNLYADTAHNFFVRDASVEDLLECARLLQSRWLYVLLFWLPFSLATAGFVLGGIAALTSAPHALPSMYAPG